MEKSEKIKGLKTFDEFYSVFERELFSDLDKIYYYDDMYNMERAKDVSYISSLFFNDCIENGKSLTQGGGNTVAASPMLIGMTNLIDSLIVVKQMVFDMGYFTLEELVSALKANWVGYEDLRAYIKNEAPHNGNGNRISRTLLGYPFYERKEKTRLYCHVSRTYPK